MTQRRTTPETFWARVEKADGCWLWRGGTGHWGYGVVSYHNRQWGAHRLAWVFTYGDVPNGLRVCHSCDNPPCVNPDHLFLGTPADNSADMVKKGRQAKGDLVPPARRARGIHNGAHTHPESVRKGERHWKARLTWSDVDSMRERYAAGLVTLDDLGSEYTQVGRAQINAILCGRAWVRLGETVPNLGKGHRRGPDGRMMKG